MNIIKNAVKDLPRTTIVTHDHIVSGLSVNKALSLVVKADYIHFVNGFEALFSSSTSELIDCCIKSGVEVAFYSSKLLKNEEQFKLIDKPIKEILINQIPNIRNIGLQGTLVSYNLLMKIEQVDEEVYTLNPSISLKCAQHSKFAVINKKPSGQKNSELKAEQDIKFHLYNLLAIYNSVKENPSAFEKDLNELIYQSI